MKLHVESFGRVGAGSAFLYTLTNASGAYVRITDYSGAVVALGVPDKKGRVDGVVAGFRDVKQYVKNDQTVEEIACELGTTHTVLKWYFTNRMHTSFRTWRISLRIQEAQRLMCEEKVAASAVHKMVGVADKSNFHKQFRQVTGVTPKEYAERALGDE